MYGIDRPLLALNYTDIFLCKEVSKVPLDGPPSKSGMFINKTSPLKEVLNVKYVIYRYFMTKYPCKASVLPNTVF